MREIRGKEIVAVLKEEISKGIEELNGYIPKLAIVRVGEEPDDVSYERGAIKNLTGKGLQAESYAFPADIDNDTFLAELKKINDDDAVDGILMLSPLPKHLDEPAAQAIISPEKDIDCIGPENKRKLFLGEDTLFVPCTAQAVLEVLDYAEVNVSGKMVTLAGYGPTVGKPLAALLLKKKATVAATNSKTTPENLIRLCKISDIVVSAVGRPGFIGPEHLSQGAIVLDVGINMTEDGKLCGDVKYDEIQDIASIATPVPGGVGSVTTTILAKHLVEAAKYRRK